MATAKRMAGGESVAAAAASAGGGRWEVLNRDLLVNIFQRVGVADLVAGVPFVCSSWRDTACDPFCWRSLDLRQWWEIAERLEGGIDIDFKSFLIFCIERGRGMLESIFFPSFADWGDLHIVAYRCPRLLYFSLPNPDMHEEFFCETVGKLKSLKGMAINERLVREKVLQNLHQCCIYLAELRVFAEFVDEEMAFIICKCLPSLRKLEITDSAISAKAIITFLDELKELEHLDISGYENSSITNVVLNKAMRLKVFLWNSKIDLGEFMDCSNCEEDWLLQRSCECMVDRKVMEWLSELS